jgi:hypothetical protein
MASDFTIIMHTRHRFGDRGRDPIHGDELEADANAMFVGQSAVFDFSCPRVDPSEAAVLQFEYRGTSQFFGLYSDPETGERVTGITPEHPVTVNGVLLPGGVPGAPFYNSMPLWAHRLLLIRGGVLREENRLHISSLPIFPRRWTRYPFDNFTIDNAVVFFKTRPADRPTFEDPTHGV